MYLLKPGIKEDPVRRWNLPDRVFFACGACHILKEIALVISLCVETSCERALHEK